MSLSRMCLGVSIIILLLVSCNSLYNAEFLVGEWKVSKWVEASTGFSRTNIMDFSFDSSKNYSVDYGAGQSEKGTYYLAGEYLHTIEEGAIEKSVRILKLTQDTMIFQMNRAGALEEVLLIRK